MTEQFYNYTEMQQLWKHVVLQAFSDACTPPPDLPPEKMPKNFDPNDDAKVKTDRRYTKEEREKIYYARRQKQAHKRYHAISDQKDARRWLTTATKDFTLACQMAGWEPDYIRDQARQLSERDWVAPAAMAANLRTFCQ